MLRIKGVVRVERHVRERLLAGIAPAQAESFRRFVLSAVHAVDSACARSHTTPRALPAPTRKAYEFLKQIDLDRLPPPSETTARGRRITSISNVTSAARSCSASLARLAAGPGPDPAEQERVVRQMARTVEAVERICERHGAALCALNAPTRRAYAWLRFLTVPANLERHLDASRRTLAIAHRLLAAGGKADVEVTVEFANTTGLWRVTQRGKSVHMRLAEGLIAADDSVLEAIVRAILTRQTARDRRQYVGFTETGEYRDVVLELELAAEIDADQPQGVAHDLTSLFDEVNAAYFGGEMTTPRLAWSDRLTLRRLGYFEPHRDRVVVSRTLDSPRVPRFVVEYILYHELLHRKLGATWRGSRSLDHTPEFRCEERKFTRWQEAEEWVRTPR